MAVSTTPAAAATPKSNRRKVWASRFITVGAVVAGGWLAGTRLTDSGSPSDLATTNSIDPAASSAVPPTTAGAAIAATGDTPPAASAAQTTVPTIVLTTDPPPLTVPVETLPPVTAPPATDPPATDPPVTDPPAATRPPVDTVTCTNDVYGYSIDYPASWYTSDGGDPYQTCTWFDPLPFDPQEMFEIDVVISAYYIDESIDQMAEWEFDPLLVTVLDQAEIVLDGRRTIVAAVEFTGGAYWPAGWIGYFYLIDWDGQTFMMLAASTLDDINEYIDVLDDMAASLRLGVAPT